jgi:hypothetical protein
VRGTVSSASRDDGLRDKVWLISPSSQVILPLGSQSGAELGAKLNGLRVVMMGTNALMLGQMA